MKYFFSLVLFFPLLTYALTKDDQYINKVTARLVLNPNDATTIIDAGTYFYKQKKYKKAIWYWSSKVIENHKQYSSAKYYQALAHLKLGDVYNAKYVLNLIDINDVSSRLRDKVLSLTAKLYAEDTKKNILAAASLSLYKGSVAYEEDVQKQSASVSGLYLMVFSDNLKIEAAFEQLEIIFNESLEYEDYTQTDYSLFISSFSNDQTSVARYGIHSNNVSSIAAFSSNSYFFSLGAYSFSGHYIGADLSYNTFSSSDVDPFASTQLSPNFKIQVAQWFHVKASTTLTSNNYEAEDVNSEGSFQSFEYSAGFTFKYLSLDFSSMKGHEKFFLKNDGFMIQNSTDTLLEGQSVSVSVHLGDLSITAKHTINDYNEENNNETYESESSILFATLNF